MDSKDWERYNCERKLVYNSLTKATRAARELRKKRVGTDNLIPYACKVCDRFHVGNK